MYCVDLAEKLSKADELSRQVCTNLNYAFTLGKRFHIKLIAESRDDKGNVNYAMFV